MASLKKVTRTNFKPTTSANAILVRAKQFNELIDDLELGTGDITANDVNVSGDLTVTGTTTLNGSLVLGDAAADSLTVNATVTQGAPVNYSNATTISAGATQTMAGATALTEEINNVTTVTTANDGVKLPTAVAGLHIYVKNSGANNLRVWTGNADDAIDAQAATALGRYVLITPGASLDFYAKDAITWETTKDASISISAPTSAKGVLQVLAADSTGDTVTTITNASQAAARTYTIPDAGTAASFVMTEGAQTINGAKTLGSVLLGPDGTGLLPTYSFTNDPNTGMFSSGANAIGFATDGTERWIINSSGAFNPLTDNANDIGNGTVNPRDIYITRGIKGISANFGVRGIADATCTLATYTTGKDIISIITLTNFIVGNMGAAAAAKAFGNLIFTFPAGAHLYTITQFNVGFTGAGTANTPDVGLGSEIASGVVATLNLAGTGTGLSEDYITGQTANDIAGTAEVIMLAPTAGLYTGIALNQAANVKLLHLNAASTWAADNSDNLTATGTITLKWSIMA